MREIGASIEATFISLFSKDSRRKRVYPVYNLIHQVHDQQWSRKTEVPWPSELSCWRCLTSHRDIAEQSDLLLLSSVYPTRTIANVWQLAPQHNTSVDKYRKCFWLEERGLLKCTINAKPPSSVFYAKRAQIRSRLRLSGQQTGAWTPETGKRGRTSTTPST